ncbi:helix-turn-helix transcriptional regulator [Psychrobium sp. 1_MG-2023]|uniref:helix-turn-helix transcriptional regulator n=1 Tax=Psychrobium sp. 1_MG-2023 TaxID=3062624 RepID=UPI0027328672|nr:AraC family transcriptional regulator [Psychrobium sp. 1_MG-2023]MDP2559976.1 AraC family transcriptional regulator [Psychrobium sp. 1_MG-2023]
MTVILGQITDNLLHQHYAVQLTVALNEPFEVITASSRYRASDFAAKPMVKHQLNSAGSVLVLLVNPASRFGHTLSKHLLKEDHSAIPEQLLTPLTVLAKQWHQQEISDQRFLELLKQLTDGLVHTCSFKQPLGDTRISQALDYIERYHERVIPATELADLTALSTSRFLHLFKHVTGVSYRRMQLWLRLMASFDLVGSTLTMTQLAHSSGFADSAHYCRTFKECFGYTPSAVFKRSEFESITTNKKTTG